MHPLAWTLWLIAAGGFALSTRNPLYLLLLVLISAALGRRRPFNALWWMLPLAAVFNALFAHAGSTVLLRLPFSAAPVTAEALAYGALNGLVLLTLFNIFQTFNTALRPRELLALTPRAFYSLAMAATLAMTYLPLLQRQAQQIWEAQLIRGQRMKGWRAWQSLLLPLLIGSLERAFALSEALVARGFLIPPQPYPPLLNIGLALTLLGLLGMLVSPDAWALLPPGLGLMSYAFWQAGRAHPRSAWQMPAWHWRDTLSVTPAFFALLALWLDATRRYDPYPALSLPPFSPAVGLALLGLLAPLWRTEAR